MAGIFVSYRRRDRPIATRFLVARLDEHYGADHVFHDLDDIDIGENFLDSIKRALDNCTVLIAVIGPDWLADYRERLQNSNDPVRLEIGTALNKQVLVVPVLLSSASMPEPGDLPADLVELHYKNAVSLRSADLDADIARLIKRLDRIPLLGQAAARQCARTAENEAPPVHADVAADSESRHTVPLNPHPFSGPLPRFSLTEEDSGRAIKFAGATIQLTRDLLDPDNPALSARAHATVEYAGKNWFIRNLSSTGATFVQIAEETELENGDCVIFGTAVFQFEEAGAPAAADSQATVALDQLIRQFGAAASPRFRLSGVEVAPREFAGEEVLINRDKLAPGNTSISRLRHAQICRRDNRWYLVDLSSNHATFVQARRSMLLCQGNALVLGGKLYRFRAE